MHTSLLTNIKKNCKKTNFSLVKFLVLKSLGLRYGVLSLRYDTAQITCSQIAPKSSPIQSIADNSSTV